MYGIGNNMILYLIGFKYDYYCQGKGTECAYTTVLVRNATLFSEACEQIIDSGEWDNPRDFEDLTI